MSLTVVPANNNSWQNQLINFVSPLLTDWIKSAREAEINRKNNAAAAEILRSVGLGGEINNTPQSLTTNNMHSNGWENAFHNQSDNPLASFDANTADIAPNANLSNSNTSLSRSMPTLADFQNAIIQQLGTKRFGMVNSENLQKIMNPLLTAYEANRIKGLRNNLADTLRDAQNAEERRNILQAAYAQGLVPLEAVNSAQAQYQYDNPYLQPQNFNDGAFNNYWNFNPKTGERSDFMAIQNNLTPQQVEDNSFRREQLKENRRKFDVTTQDNRDFRTREQAFRERQQDFLEEQARWAREHPEYARYTDSQGKLWGLKPGESQAVAITGPDGQQLTGEPNMYWPAQNATRTTTTSAKNNSTTNPVIELLNKDLESLENEEKSIREAMNNSDNVEANADRLKRLQQIKAEKEAIRAARYRALAPSNTPTSSREIPAVSLGSQFIGNANTGRISRNGEFGNDRGDHLHHGTDYPVREGEPIRLPDFWGDSLKVVKAHTNPKTSSFGNHVILEGNVGGQTVRFTLAHMKTGSVRVKVGQIIKPGDLIGQVGNTGRSHGAHLHLEVRVNGQRIDPEKYFQTMQHHFPAQNPNDNVNLTPFPRDNEANTTQNPQNTQNNPNPNNNTQNSNSHILWKHKDNGHFITEAQYQSFIQRVEAGEVEGIKNREEADNYLVREGYIRENQSHNPNPNQPNITPNANDTVVYRNNMTGVEVRQSEFNKQLALYRKRYGNAAETFLDNFYTQTGFHKVYTHPQGADDPVVYRHPQTGNEIRLSELNKRKTEDDWSDSYADQIYRSAGYVKVQNNTTPQNNSDLANLPPTTNNNNNQNTPAPVNNSPDAPILNVAGDTVIWVSPDGKNGLSQKRYDEQIAVIEANGGWKNPQTGETISSRAEFDAYLERYGWRRTQNPQNPLPDYTNIIPIPPYNPDNEDPYPVVLASNPPIYADRNGNPAPPDIQRKYLERDGYKFDENGKVIPGSNARIELLTDRPNPRRNNTLKNSRNTSRKQSRALPVEVTGTTFMGQELPGLQNNQNNREAPPPIVDVINGTTPQDTQEQLDRLNGNNPSRKLSVLPVGFSYSA